MSISATSKGKGRSLTSLPLPFCKRAMSETKVLSGSQKSNTALEFRKSQGKKRGGERTNKERSNQKIKRREKGKREKGKISKLRGY